MWFAGLKCDISHVRQDRCQWRGGSSALPVSQRRSQGSYGNQGDQMEFYEIPCRSKGRGSGSLRTGGGTQGTRKGNREAALARVPPDPLPPAVLRETNTSEHRLMRPRRRRFHALAARYAELGFWGLIQRASRDETGSGGGRRPSSSGDHRGRRRAWRRRAYRLFEEVRS